MAENEVTHLSAAAAIPAQVDDDRVGALEEPQRLDRDILVALHSQEPGDLEVTDVAVEDLHLPHSEVELGRVADAAGSAAGPWRGR
jgi:hypothetical protein